MTTYPSHYPRLVADIGGTNARFAIMYEPFDLRHIEVLSCADYDSLLQAMRAYREKHNLVMPRSIGIGIANPISGDIIKMTNNHWHFSISDMKNSLEAEHFVVINDFTAQALAITKMPADMISYINGPQKDCVLPKNKTCAVIGPGTGLGVSGLIPNEKGGFVALSSEGGHATFTPYSTLEQELQAYAQNIFGSHVSFEQILQGAGLTLIYEFLAKRQGVPITKHHPADVTYGALQEQDALCIEVLSLYCQILGGFCADVVLTIGGVGGVYIAGGIIPRFTDFLKSSDFRMHFEAKGLMSNYLSNVPVYVVEDPYSGILGAAVALDNQIS